MVAKVKGPDRKGVSPGTDGKRCVWKAREVGNAYAVVKALAFSFSMRILSRGLV